MTRLPFSPPSATSVAIAAAVALALGFVRCGAGSPMVAQSSSEAASHAPTQAPGAAQFAAESSNVDPPPAPSASAAGSAAAERPAPSRRYVVAVVGDSLTDARSGGGKYVDYLARHCPQSQFDNYGKGGDMVNQMRRRFERDVLFRSTPYTHLLVFGGVNDLYSDLTAGRTPEKVGKDLAAMYSAAKKRGWDVVAVTVAPWGGFSKYYNDSRAASTRTLNDWMKAQLDAKTVDYVVDAWALLSCGDAERLCAEYAAPYKDGLHFGPKGHEKLGKALLESVFAGCL